MELSHCKKPFSHCRVCHERNVTHPIILMDMAHGLRKVNCCSVSHEEKCNASHHSHIHGKEPEGGHMIPKTRGYMYEESNTKTPHLHCF